MRFLKKILSVIFNPISSLYLPSASDQIVKKTNKYSCIVYIIAAILTAVIILVVYKNYIFK